DPHLTRAPGGGETLPLPPGHSFAAFGAGAGGGATRLGGEALPLEGGRDPSIRDLVGLNLPLSQLASAGIGQSQPLTRVVRSIQREVTAGQTATVRRYLERLESGLRGGNGLRAPARVLRSFALRWLKPRILPVVGTR